MPPVIAVIQAIGALIPGIAAATTAATVAGTLIVASAALALRSLIPKVDMGVVDTDRSRQTTVRSTIEPRKLIYGETMVSGVVSFAQVNGTNNKNLHQVIAIAGHKLTSIDKIFFDDYSINLSTQVDGSGDVTSGKFAKKTNEDGVLETMVHIETRDGSSTQTAYSDLVTAFAGTGVNAGKGYESTHRGDNVASIYTRWTIHEGSAETWDEVGGIQNIKAVVKGKAVYDPRLEVAANGGDATTAGDSPNNAAYITYSNGSTTATHQRDLQGQNPALILADYLMDATFGLGVPSTKIDWAAVITAADACDFLVPIPTSQTQKRFFGSGVIFGSDNHRKSISKILSGMNGDLIYSQGKYIIKAGIHEIAALTFTEDDLAGDFTVKTSIPRADRYNTIKGMFIDPDSNYKMTEFSPRTVSGAVARDNGEVLEEEIKLTFTSDRYAAQRIAIKKVHQSFLQTTLTLPVNLKGMKVAVGDRIKLALNDFATISSDWNPNKEFKVIGWSFSESGNGAIELNLVEDDSSRYVDPAEADYNQISNTGVITSSLPPVPLPTNFTATAGYNSVNLAWTNPTNIGAWEQIWIYASDTTTPPATPIEKFRGTAFTHQIAGGTAKYYWIQAVKYPLGATPASGSTNTAKSALVPFGSPTAVTALKIANAVMADDSINTAQIIDDAVGSDQIATALQSSNWSVQAQTGWRIEKSGDTTFNNAVIRGNITASTGSIGGITVDADSIYVGTGTFNNANTAFYADDQGQFSLKDKLSWDGSALTISGQISATTGAIGGFSIGSDYIADAADSMGLASTVTAGDDVRFWAGDTFANRASAPFRVTEAGVLTATSGSIGNSVTVGGTAASTVASDSAAGNQAAEQISLLPRADDSEWTVGTGAKGIWSLNGGTSENAVVVETGPHGELERIWKATSTDGSGADGGFQNTATPNRFPIVSDTTYRFSVFIKQDNTNGTLYLGAYNYDSGGSTISLYKHDGTGADTNKYWFGGDLPTQGEWYLLVGFINPSNTNSNSGKGGIYNVATGVKVTAFDDFRFSGDGSETDATTFSVRTYNYYAVASPTSIVRWAHPRVDRLDRRAPSIAELLRGWTSLAEPINAGVTITGGGITMSNGGSIKGGQTAFNTGTGFFLGYDATSPAGYKFSVGNAGNNSLTFEDGALSVSGTVNASAGAFTGDVSTDAKFIAGSNSSTVTLDGTTGANYSIFAGADNSLDASFKVASDGVVEATRFIIRDDANGQVLIDTSNTANPFSGVVYTSISQGSGAGVDTVAGTLANNAGEITITTTQAETFLITAKVAIDDNDGSTNNISGASTVSTTDAENQLKGADLKIEYYLKEGAGAYALEDTEIVTFTEGTPSSSQIKVFGVDRGAGYSGSLTRYFAVIQSGGAAEFVTYFSTSSNANRARTYAVTTASISISGAGTHKIKILARLVDAGTNTTLTNSTTPALVNNNATGTYGGSGIVLDASQSPPNQSSLDNFKRIYEATSANGFVVSAANTFAIGEGTTILTSGGTISGNLVITGDLTVSGTTTTVNTDNLTVKDPNITLNYSTGDSSSTANNAGITIQDAVSATSDASILWKTASDTFEFSHGLVAPTIVSGDIDIGDGTAREELKIKSNSYAEVQYFIKHANNSNVLTEYIRAGVSVTESSYNQVIGDYFLFSVPSSNMLLTVPQNGDPLRRNNGAITIIDSTNYGTYALPLTGGTLSGNLLTTGTLQFDRGSGSDKSNIIQSANFPSEGYTASTQKYWLEYKTKGGHHFVVNTDGGSTDSENDFDHFTIWQGAIDGMQLFRLTNTGNATLRQKLTVDVANKDASWGSPILGMSTNWNGSTSLPTLTSAGGSTNNGIFLDNVHINYRTDNKRSGAAGRAGVRMASDALGNWWDAGLTGDQYEIYRSASTAQLFALTSSGNATFAGTLSSGAITSSGTVTATGGSSTNWNTAYNYSQVGHVPINGSTVTTPWTVWGIVQNTNTGTTGYSEMHIRNDAGTDLVIGSIGSGYTNASFSDSRYIYSTGGKLHLKATTNLVLSSGGTATTAVALTADTNQEITIHKDMNLVGEFNGSLFMRDGRITVKQGTGLTATIIPANTSSDRAQLLLDSSYSDMIIASRAVNANTHGSTLTFATQSTSTTDYAKIVVGQGQYQEGNGLLAFAHGINQSNPHSILGTDNAYAGVVMDLYNKRIGIGGGLSKDPLTTIHASGGKIAIASTDTSYGQIRVSNTALAEVSIGFLNQVTESTLGASSPTATKKWAMGLNIYGIGTDTFGIGNVINSGVVQISADGKTTFGEVSGVSSNVGRSRVGTDTSSGWGTTTKYPYLGSDGSISLIMLQNPHVPLRTDNVRSGASGRAGIRMAQDAGGNWWDMGLIGDEWEIYRNGTGQLLHMSNAGKMTMGLTASEFRIHGTGTRTRKIVLYDGDLTNNYQFYGFGVEAGSFINSITATDDTFYWYAGVNSTSRQLAMSLSGEGALTVKNDTFIDGGSLTVTDHTHNYLRMESSSNLEQMVRFKNSATNYWYAGIRTSAGIGSTTGFHIYSTALGNDAFALDTSGNGYFNASVRTNNILYRSGSNGLKVGGFTDANTDETGGTVVTWLRSGTWDNYLIKGSTSRGKFGTQFIGEHINSSKSWGIFSSGWDTELQVNGDGLIYLKGPVGINYTPSNSNYGPLGRKGNLVVSDTASAGANSTIVVECNDTGESSLYLCETGGASGYGARLYYEGSGSNFFNIEIIDDDGATKFPTAFTIDRDAKVGINDSSPESRFSVYQDTAQPTASFRSAGTSNFGASVLVGTETIDWTLQDSNDRPMVIIDGQYPVLNINHTVQTNSNHGPTIQFTYEGYTGGGSAGGRQIVIGTDGQGQRLDFGFAGGSITTEEDGTAANNNTKNPHNGIAGYAGRTPMRLFSNGLLLGLTGGYPNEITSISNALDVRGSILNSLGVFSSRADSTPNGTQFGNTFSPLSGSSRVVYFDGAGTAASTWYGNGNVPYSAIDVNSNSMNFWMHVSGYWYNMVDISTSGIVCSSNITAYGSTSDIRLKENIETIPNALDKVMSLRGVTFNYKKDGSKSTGLIAQELLKVLPEVVYETKDLHQEYGSEDTEETHYAVRYGNVVGLLVEAIKELKTENEDLKKILHKINEKLGD